MLSKSSNTGYFKMRKENTNIFLVVFWKIISITFALGGRVAKITPTSGSLLGATRLTIHGEGFANDQFNWYQEELGNSITLVSVSRAHVLPCDVITYYTTPYRIVCTTRPSPFGEGSYNIRITVDGQSLDNSNGDVYCGNECVFKFTKGMTPMITSVTPRYGLPGTLLTINGRMFTDQVIETEDYNPNKEVIERVYAGAGLCEIYNTSSQELYGVVSAAETGFIKCKPNSTIVGSQRASFIVSGYGRSQMSREAISVDSHDRLYLFQTHADVEEVSPSIGSIAGGTILTISGKGFDKHAKNISAHAAGVPCKILDIQNEVIKCQTNAAPQPLSDGENMYPGNRGLLREVWTNTRPSSVSAVGGLSTSASDYHSEIVSESSSPTQASFGQSSSFSDRYRGFFVPPSDNNYTFFIQADDQAELYLSLNESAAAKTMIASCSKPTASWTTSAEQKSAVFSLKRGRRYYIEALHVQDGGKSHVSIGVKLQKTRFVNSQIGAAVNEKQEIRMNSVKHPEIQVINITNWDDGKKFEVQDVEVISCKRAQGNDTNCKDAFSVSYGGLNMAPVLVNNMTAKNLQQALNNLTSITKRGRVDVTEVITGNNTMSYRVTFHFDDPTDTQMLLNNTSGSNGTSVKITRFQKGVPGNYWFKLFLAGRTTNSIHIKADASDLKQELQNMTSWYCSYQTTQGRAYYYNGFEKSPQGPLWGERVFKTRPNCGRFSLKSPKYLFYGGRTKDILGRVLKGYDVARYKQLCFSYQGKMKNYIKVYISYTDTSGSDQAKWRTYSVVTIHDNSWHQLCTNIHDLVSYDKSLLIDPRFKTYVEVISLDYWGVDFYVDDIFIWRDAVRVQRLLQAAEPGGHIMESVDVQKLGPSAWSVSLTPSSCGTGLELLQIAQAQVISGNTSSGHALFKPINATENSTILVSREQTATPPIGGTFDLGLQGVIVKGIPVNVSQDKLQFILENNFNIGKVSVNRVGTCASSSWTVEWATTGGDQPFIEVNGTCLTGNSVSVQATTIDDGGLFLRPIPGDMLRVAEMKPQVTVSLNGIPSSCSKRQCSFTFTSRSTPVLTSVSPQRGPAGTEITLTGSGFSSSVAKVNVTIGGINCHVTSASLSNITCVAGESIGGSQEIIVVIGDKGVAKPASRNVWFTYPVIVNEMQPGRGSSGGGTVVTLKGNGFGATFNVSRVLIGDSICNIIHSNLTELMCVTSPHARGNASVHVTVGSEVGTLLNAFVFDSGMTPTVSSLSASQGSVSGGEELVIHGSGFEVSKTFVHIGPNPCNVTSLYSTLIKCTTPANAPGIYDVKVDVNSKGYAVDSRSLSKLPHFKYVLEITGISPRYGSIFGGTIVTVTGRGFSDNNAANVVDVGDIPCKVLSSRTTEIVCKTGAAYTTHTVDNTGQHPEYGIGYGWNPQTIVINVGDFVQWKWTSPYLSGMFFGVQQTSDSTATVYDGKGFKSARSGNGNFSQQFNVRGTYYYSSGAVDPYGAINMKGRVIVNDLKTKSFHLKVRVGGFLAPYNGSGAGPLASNSSDCQKGVNSAIPQCSIQGPLQSKPASLSFTFWNCSTPEVTSISPNSGTCSTILTIKGKGFAAVKCLNKVKIGSIDCVVQSSTENEIKCLVTTGNQLIAGIPHSVSVRVNNRGLAVIKVENKLSSSFLLQPTVQSVSPQSGSVKGGSFLTIKGDGFSLDNSQTYVHIGGAACKIDSISYSQIRCKTSEKRASQALDVEVKVNGVEAHCSSIFGCSFTYSTSKTPKVDSVTPSAIVGTSNVIRIYGSGFPSKMSDLDVRIGNISCTVVSSSQYSASCRLGPIVAGKHTLRIHIAGQGLAMFESDASSTVDSLAVVSSLTPVEGSIMGGTEVSIKGSGFDTTEGRTTVEIGDHNCTVIRVTSSEVGCITSAHSPGSFKVIVTANAQQFPRLRYLYRKLATPYVTSVSPAQGKIGQTVTISGSGFSPDTANMRITIANTNCTVLSSTSTRLTCELGSKAAGVYDVILHVKGKGLAAYSSPEPLTFTYEISLVSISPNACGFGGGRIVSVKGHGFDDSTTVKICDNICRTINSTLNEIFCEVPAYAGQPGDDDIMCSVSVTGNGKVTSSRPNLFTYRESLTSRITSVMPSRGGTGGGVEITMKGNGFSTSQDGNRVTIADVPCKVTFFSLIEIRCVTGPRSGDIQSKVRIEVDNHGVATQDRADFQYIDLWSSPFTWGYKSPPGKGDFVEISKGQTILLDEDTPVFSILVIRGQLIFDEKDLTLNAKKILVVDGGKLQVGTASKPFQHKAKIVLHGHLHNKRLPIFGTKVLAVREGTLDLHGRVVPITWTQLAKTAVPGDTQLSLKHSVTWNIGDQIVLASTSRRQDENEELSITSISNDGRTIGITPVVKDKHISLAQNISGRYIETRAEVGLLTRNVVVEGSENDEWSEKIPECPEDFDPGIFAVQTCFQGRYGDEMASEQFGSQIMINAKMQSKGLVTGRISYVEVRKAGQAFGLGRYPIHFHLSGDVSGSYVRGCAIHHTFNRAVTVHGVTGLVVEHNVAYHVKGHAYFIEDGIETGNTIQYNLGVFVQSSSTLLTTDSTPATFWVTNPNNTIRHNAAAAGSHHGYWYNLPNHPGGPSFTTSVCPKNAPLGEFQNNTAHSFGRYGVWIFQDYFPMKGGACNSKVSEPAKFYTLLAYNNLKGFELTNGGAIQTINFTVIDNKEAGIEFTQVNAPWGESGPLVKDSLIVGHSAVSESPSACTQGGLVAPQSSRLTVSRTTFVNFDAPSCAALRACSFCKQREGGFTTRFEKTKLLNSPNKAAFEWEHEAVFEDLDGTLTGLRGGGSILPSNPNLPSKHCSQSKSASVSKVSGSVCNSTMRFRRLSWNGISPKALDGRDALLTNEAGTSRIPWRFMRVTHNRGWMATVILGQNYNFSYHNAPQLTNISYSAVFYEFGDQDFLWITHPMKQTPDMISTTGKFVNMTSGIPFAGNASNGDWHYNNVTKQLTYIVSGRGETGLVNRKVKLKVERCYFKNCIKPIPPPPPEKRPLEYLRWSVEVDWYWADPGYGGYNKQLPEDGDDVIIKQNLWMVADTELPSMRKLFIYGTLELEPHMDFVLNATYIVVGDGGNLIIGWEDTPMIGSVLISLNGNHDTPDIPIQDGPNVGSKALAVFGNMEIHGLNRSVYWSRLRKTADSKSDVIHLEEIVDWEPGDEIVIAPTSFEPYHTEILKIVNVELDGKTIRLNQTLKHRHLAESYTTGDWNYTLAAEVGLLTRNIVIEGADDTTKALDEQSFGCRVLFGSFKGSSALSRRIRVENVEFRHCGQEGWSDPHDPRYSLAVLDAGNLKTSYIRGNSFRDGFNTAIGVFGTDDLTILDNVIHHTVGSAVRVWGRNNKVLHNLVVLSVSPATFKGRHEDENQLWHASFDISKTFEVTLRHNAAAGSERVGFHIRGENCYQDNPEGRWIANTAHTTLQGVHIGYHDGLPGCLKIANFVIWKNYDYGVFGFPKSRVIVQDTVVADSYIGILINIWNPPALSHHTADKFVRLDRVLIIGTSPSVDCLSFGIVPRNSGITQKVRPPRYKGGGNIGFMLSSFASTPGLAPEKPWHLLISAPAIRGVVRLSNVGFAHFGTRCGRDSVVFSTNPGSPDAFHPVLARGISMYNVDSDKLFHIPPSNIGWINPSDCVDMDCDGAKHVLIKDLDGSLTGVAGGSVIPKAEYEWNGDPRRGLGDYRIPRPLLTSSDGSRLNTSVVAPHHGIVRGTRTQSFCSWVTDWNAYKCSTLDYHMLVIESLDADTELRRLSPVALSANGYTDLLNGPMDHGCCFGYSCMERLSTFYSIVAAQNNYTLYFTGTNPQNLRLTLLNANETQALRVAIWYSTPRRLDVYRAGVYMYPTNAKLDVQNFSYKKKDPSLPDDQFEPSLSRISGANYYERESQLLYVVLKGNIAVDIRTAPVIQVKLGSKPVHFNDFFEKNLIQNLASLLGIDESRIRVVEIVNAAGDSRRRRRDSDDDTMTVTLEIGDPPQKKIPFKPEETYVPGNSSYTTASPVTLPTTALPTPAPMDQYIALQSLASKAVAAAQTGRMASSVNLDILSVEVTDPEPPRELPKGWKRATPEDAGPKNGTWRFDQVESMKEGNKSSPVHDYLIPVRLVVLQQPFGANETVPFLVQPKLRMIDNLNRTVSLLGHGQQGQWYVTASIMNGTGDPEALLGGNTTVPFIDGWANFTNLNISHNHTEYMLEYKVTFPVEANFTAHSDSFEVKERILYFTLVSQPMDANETVPFGQQPLVEVRDAANGELVTNTGWKGRKWICKAFLRDQQSLKGNLSGAASVEFSTGVASFTDLSINHEGKSYVLDLEAFTVPSSRYQFSTNAEPFDVKERFLELVISQQPGDCNDTVSCGFQPILEIRDTATDTLVGNLGWRGRTWTINATMGSGNAVIIGLTRFQIPRSGRAEFPNISFYDVASGYKMKFEVTVTPHSQTYSGMVAISNTFDVNPRQFYLDVTTQVSNANQSVIFGTQPVVEVRDLGTGKPAAPLKNPWWIAVSLFSNPKLGKAFLNGTFNVSVDKEQAVFNDLLVTLYGQGYVLKFESSYGHSVFSDPFEVHYVNDYPPVFVNSSGNYIVNISEAVSIGSFVINIHATDSDKGSQGDVYYALIGGNTGISFNLNQTSGAVTTAKKLDRETTASYHLVVKAFDGAVQEKIRFTLGHVLVKIDDINDNAPQFTKKKFTSSVNETADLDDVVLRVWALDRDAGMNSDLSFSITSGNTDGYFDIIPSTGDIVVKKSLDLEGQSPPSLNYSLGVHVTDMGVSPLSNSTTVTVNISPVNEFSPEFIHSSFAEVNVKENQATGDGLVLFNVNATDKDFGQQGLVHYYIFSGNDDRKFQINPNTGLVKLISPLDYETAPNYTLIIRASDTGEHARYAEFTLFVKVDDVNDNSPQFEKNMTTVEVAETLSIGQVAATIQATDRDSGENGRVTYSIYSGDSGAFFKIDPNSGKVTTLKSLDLESAQIANWTFTLLVVAKDHGKPELSGNATYELKVDSVNEFTPQFTQPGLSLQIPEDKTVGALLCQVTATDKDFGPDGVVRYQIEGGNDDKRFRIDSFTGKIYVHAPLDRETTPTYHLKIMAFDKPTQIANQRSSLIFVNVTLTDVNDNKPVFKTSSYYVAIKETAGVGDDVINVEATDADAGTNGQIEYKIKSGNSHEFFEINAYTGIIKVKKSLDLETQQHLQDLLYTLTIEAYDKGSLSSLSNVVPVTIEIQSVNEFAPKLQHPDSIYVKIPENIAVGSKIADINATDKDYRIDGQLTYSIFSGNEDNKFAINSNTGVITINNELDYETVVRYSLSVRVSDNAPPAQRLSTVAKVTVRLTNVNDSGGVDVLIQDVRNRITHPGDPAEVVGVATSSPISVVLLYESGKQEKLSPTDSRLTFDDNSESRGLFRIVQIDGKKVIEANRAGLLGQGVLIVRVHNVYSVRVKIDVVGYSSLTLWAVPYPLVNQSNAILSSLKRIGSYLGNYQLAALQMYLLLTDNSTYDVSLMTSASFEFVSNDIGVKVSLGPNPKNLLSADKQSAAGWFSICGKFAGKISPSFDLEVSTDVISVNQILAVELNGLRNETLVGLAHSTKAQIQGDFRMNDSSVLRIQDFVKFSDLVTFAISNAQAASVDSKSGVITLNSDYRDIVTVTVTPLQGIAKQKFVHFYCNTVPPVGGVDIGQEVGPALPPITANHTITIPVRVNTGMSKLLAYDVKISYDFNKVRLVAIKRAKVYSHTEGQLHLADVTDPDNVSSHIADLIFDTKSGGELNFQASVSTLIDQKLHFIGVGNNKPAIKQCADLPLGDVTADCVFDIQDAAYTMAYSLAQERNFNGKFEKSLFKKTTAKMVTAMDFNVNGDVERNDAYLLSRANLDMARFIRDWRVTTPDHLNKTTKCEFKITIKLSKRSGSPETNTKVFFEFASGETMLSSQLHNTEFDAGELVKTYDNLGKLFGGIVKAESRGDSFHVEAKKSQMEIFNMGLSVIIVTEDSERLAPVVTPYFMYARPPMFSSELGVKLAPNVVWVLKNAHSPQLMVYITESYASCQDPPVINNVMIVFENDYKDVQGKEETFMKVMIKDFTDRLPLIKIEKVRLAAGSILVYFDVIVPKSRMKNTLLALWDMVKSGYTLQVNDTKYRAKPVMRVGGKDYPGNDKPEKADESASKFPVGAVVGICVLVILTVIVTVVCFCYKNRLMQKRKAFKWKSVSKISILDSRSTSRMSEETRDHEMIMFSGLSNDNFHSSDDDAFPSPVTSSHTSLTQFLKPEENFVKRKSRQVGSTSSQASLEAWTGNSSPALLRRQMELGPPSPQLPVPSSELRGPSSVGKLQTKRLSNSELLTQETSSAEGSPLDMTPQISRRRQSPNKRCLMVQNSMSASDSSDEEPAVRSRPTSSANTHASGQRSLTPQTSGSKLLDNGRRSLSPPTSGSRCKDHGSEVFIFEKPVLYRKLKSQESGSRHSSHNESGDSTRSGSGHSTPRVTVTSLPPGFVQNSNDGNDITIEEESYTVRLPVNILNTVKEGESGKPFTKIGFIEFPSNATLSEIRQILKKDFAEILQSKLFLFQDAMMADVEPLKEEATKSIYNLSVIIRFTNERESARLFCTCGTPAHFQCSACFKRGYCGRECQLKDWCYHKIVCESVEVSSV